jgi:hypothetical protein
MNRKILIAAFFIVTLFSCSSESRKQGESNSLTQSTSSSYDDNSNESLSSSYSNEENDEENNEYSNDCKFEDGTYSATVDYNNPETGYSATYTLDVEVQDCQVVQINFPNDGYLDDDHISYADIDEDGYASIEGEEGKTYEIQIDN